MQMLMRPGSPSCSLATNRGSASMGRAIDTRSASPPARILSATSGVLMRLLATTGMPTAALTRAVAQLQAAAGTS